MHQVHFAILTAALLSVFCLSPSSVRGDDPPKVSKAEQTLIDMTNAERKKANKPALAANEKLMQAARGHAANMAKQNKLEHELDGKLPADRIKDAGYDFSRCGENVSWNQRTIREAVNSWMQSEHHRENILHDDFTEIGVAMAKNSRGEWYYVQVFGNPK